jgi:hypothetical protein
MTYSENRLVVWDARHPWFTHLACMVDTPLTLSNEPGCARSI